MPANTNVIPTKANMTFCIFMTSPPLRVRQKFRDSEHWNCIQAAAVCSAFLVACRQRQSLPNYNCPIQMQSNGQYDNVESTALAKEDRADNSDVPKIQRESIRTRRERLHGMRVNIERTLAVGLSQEFLNGFDIFSIRLQQGAEGGPIAHPILSLISFSRISG